MARPKRAAAPKRRAAARKATARKAVKKAAKPARPAAKRAAKKTARTAAAKTSTRIVRRVANKATSAAPKAAPRKVKVAKKAVKAAAVRPAKRPPSPAPPRALAVKRKAAAPVAGKKKQALGLDRERRVVGDDDDIVSPTPPSSLNLDRSASAARTGRQELRERYDNHNETSPALTGGDVDADWESAYSVGDEAPGGDNPTPDQNNVDDIGVALGVEYEDNEELEGADKIEERDRHRWEDDPASSEDFEDR
jgi:hypothetical protein